MKLRKLIPATPALIVALAASVCIASCGEDTKSESNSTSPVTEDTLQMTNSGNATGDMSVPTNDMTTAERTTASDPVTTTGRTPKKVKVTAAVEPASTTTRMSSDNAGYYNYAEVAPVFRGGQGAIEDYINNNIEYPQQAIDNNVEGTVRVQFGVDEKGNVSQVTTVGNKLGYGLEEEAIRVVSNMAKWSPGQVKGKTVRTKMVIPITYRIES
ncbi:MAG TPA: energy transducer TonB [Chitinophagaceae bacterium]|nr:energy transducer TonB [Chitinophagaceae bacterium]